MYPHSVRQLSIGMYSKLRSCRRVAYLLDVGKSTISEWVRQPNTSSQRNIYYIVDVDDDGNTKRTYKLTRGQYYRLSGCHLATKQGIKWCDNVRSALELFSMTTTKTVDMDDLLYYFEVYMRVEQQLWGEFLRARWSGKRLRTYVARNVSWQTFSTP